MGASEAAGAGFGSFFDAIIERTEPGLMASIPSDGATPVALAAFNGLATAVSPAGFVVVVTGARGGVLARLVVGVTAGAVEAAGFAAEAAGAGVGGADVTGVAGVEAGAADGVDAVALFVFHSEDSPPPVAAGVGVVVVDDDAAGVGVDAAAAALLLAGTGLLGAANVLVSTAGAKVKPLTQLSQTFCFTVNEICGRISRFFK